jgi:hypothetical protein
MLLRRRVRPNALGNVIGDYLARGSVSGGAADKAPVLGSSGWELQPGQGYGYAGDSNGITNWRANSIPAPIGADERQAIMGYFAEGPSTDSFMGGAQGLRFSSGSLGFAASASALNDRERVAARQAAADLKKEQSARTADQDAARAALEAAREALQAKKAAHTEAASAWSRQEQATQVELATLRERAGAAEQRAGDLALQLQRQQAQAEREMAHLRESQAATAAALRQLEVRQEADAEKTPPGRAPRGKKSSN